MYASLVKLSHFSVPVNSHFRVVILMSFDITKRRSHVQSSFLFTTCFGVVCFPSVLVIFWDMMFKALKITRQLTLNVKCARS